jgi:hypothetical protein
VKVNDATSTRAVRRRFVTRMTGPVRSPRVTAGRWARPHSICMGRDATRVAGAGVVEGASELGATAMAAATAPLTTTIRPGRLRRESPRLIRFAGYRRTVLPLGLCYWGVRASCALTPQRAYRRTWVVSRRRARPLVAAVLFGAVLGCSVLVAVLARDGAAPKSPHNEPRTVPLAPEARAAAEEFIRTAVVRKNLDRAWLVSGPGIRQCLTLGEWMTGNIPVLPYPDADLSRSPVRIEWSYPTQASLEVNLGPKRGSIDKPQLFHLGLTRRGTGGQSRWVVDWWTADAPVSPPVNVRC